MCARYTQIRDLAAILAQLRCLNRLPPLAPRYNIAPRQMAPVIIHAGAQIETRAMRWGLIPAWAKDEKIGQSLINARSESVAEKPSFRTAFRQRRCLVPADGFYEWETTPEGKSPRWFTLADDGIFCFAGLWEAWTPPPSPQGDLFAAAAPTEPPLPVETFTIITTAANELVTPLHDRMPVILTAHSYERWLDPQTPPDELRWLLRPYPAAQMQSRRASRRVNSPRTEGPECLAADDHRN